MDGVGDIVRGKGSHVDPGNHLAVGGLQIDRDFAPPAGLGPRAFDGIAAHVEKLPVCSA